jgi:hypothetical protein
MKLFVPLTFALALVGDIRFTDAKKSQLRGRKLLMNSNEMNEDAAVHNENNSVPRKTQSTYSSYIATGEKEDSFEDVPASKYSSDVYEYDNYDMEEGDTVEDLEEDLLQPELYNNYEMDLEAEEALESELVFEEVAEEDYDFDNYDMVEELEGDLDPEVYDNDYEEDLEAEEILESQLAFEEDQDNNFDNYDMQGNMVKDLEGDIEPELYNNYESEYNEVALDELYDSYEMDVKAEETLMSNLAFEEGDNNYYDNYKIDLEEAEEALALEDELVLEELYDNYDIDLEAEEALMNNLAFEEGEY